MLEQHPGEEELAAFLRWNPAPEGRTHNAQILRHLLADCATCRDRLTLMGWSRQRLARLVQLPPREGSHEESISNAYDYSKAFAAAERSVIAFLAPEQSAEVASAPSLLEQVEALPAEERIAKMSAPPFASPALARLLIERSHEIRHKDAGEMLHYAQLARIAAEACLPDQTGGDLRLADLRARSWSQYGSALRVCGRSFEAQEALATAQRYRAHGTGDPLLRAWILERAASLLVFQGKYPEAIERFEEAGQIHKDLDEGQQLASVLVQRAIASIYSGDTERAISILNRAIPMIDDEQDPHLLLAACHNLIWCYVDVDRPDQALTLYNEARELYQRFDDPLILLRATWQEGRLLRDLGHLRAAETVLLRARKGFLDRKLSYEVALVSLDLAAVYVKLGWVEEVKRTVLMTVPIFHALRVKLETLASLLQLQQVADQEQQALDLIRTLNTRVTALSKDKASH
jgi:tetratricopeptide (TPR) repeat protein